MWVTDWYGADDDVELTVDGDEAVLRYRVRGHQVTVIYAVVDSVKTKGWSSETPWPRDEWWSPPHPEVPEEMVFS